MSLEPNKQQTVKDMLTGAMMKRLERVMNPPEKPKAEKRPKNNLWIAYAAFNVMLAFLDLITAYTVGTFTLWFYGVLVFFAGYGPLLLWETLFIRPYASTTQKRISIGGALIGAVSTIGVGILVAILNVININELIGAGTLEVIIVVSLVILSSAHIALFGWYFFSDLGWNRERQHANVMAEQDAFKQSVGMSKAMAMEVIGLGKDLEAEERAGRGELVKAAMKRLGHSDFFDEEDEKQPVPVSRNNGNHPY